MPKYTKNIILYKPDSDTDLNNKFNIDTILNNNWDKIDYHINDLATITEKYINSNTNDIVDGAPENLNTLNKIAISINYDPNFNFTIMSEISYIKKDVIQYVDNKILEFNKISKEYIDNEVLTTTEKIMGETKKYSDSQDAIMLQTSKTYTDTKSAETLNSAKNYADSKDTTVLNSMKLYTDTKSTEALSSAKAYTDTKSTETLNSAKSYADTNDATTLSSAKTYADTKSTAALNSAKSYADTGDAATLSSAKAYTDTKSTETLNSAKSYADTGDATTLSSAKTHANTKLPLAGGTLTGQLVANSNTSYATRQVHNTIISTADANVDNMQNGDIWIKYI